ncbi:MAG: glutathione S-transferase, partial [Kiloniellaceae bacterium]|nr:glutathione S-transferase [Kiloniellaceae bacterium]
MAQLEIVIGNKRYSSWSLRGWLALAMTGQPFAEQLVWLDKPATKGEILASNPSGRVPALIDGELVVWDSLAIGEYLAERFPEAGLWPADPAARALARSVVAEMHAGFAALRQHLPMDLGTQDPTRGRRPEAQADIARIIALWQDCRARHGQGGPFL